MAQSERNSHEYEMQAFSEIPSEVVLHFSVKPKLVLFSCNSTFQFNKGNNCSLEKMFQAGT